MPNIKTPFLLLPLFMLACSLTAQVTPPNERSAAALTYKQATPTPTLTPTIPPFDKRETPPPVVCQVKTGLSEGRLNVRSCGGLACPVLAVIREGDNLTIIQTVNSWLEVQTASGLRGWVNSNYCPLAGVNEVKK